MKSIIYYPIILLSILSGSIFSQSLAPITWDTTLSPEDPVWKMFEKEEFSPEEGLEALEKRIPFLKESLQPFYPSKTARYIYDPRRHTLNWLRQYEKYFSKQDPHRAFMRFLGIMHDHSKYDCLIEYGTLRSDHILSRIQIGLLHSMGALPFNHLQINLMAALIQGNPIGSYLTGTQTLEQSINEILLMQGTTMAPLDDFFQILVRYYQADSSAYTKDSDVEKVTIENWYEFEKTKQGERIRFDPQKNRMIFTPELEKKFQQLESALAKKALSKRELKESMREILWRSA